jgi:hypothetical protein
MAQVLDYSAGFPGAQAIRGAGYVGAVRYIGFPDRPKCTTSWELADFTNQGLGMALVFENSTTDWRGGYAGGQASGRRARDHANSIGFPADRPIYMAVDQDVVTPGDFNVMTEYLRGAGSSLGGAYVTGVYGEADVIDRARDAGVATWFWQTVAWSRGRRTAAHLFQHVGTVYVGGVACDVNDVLADDWGQHTGGGDMPLNQDDIDKILSSSVQGPDGWQYTKDVLAWAGYAARVVLPRIEAKIDAGFANLSETEATIIAEIRAHAQAGGAPATAQMNVLATQLAQSLGSDRAAELGQLLRNGSGNSV